MDNDNNLYDQETKQEAKKELPDENVEHDFQSEKAELQENNQNNCQSCNDLKNNL